MINLHVLPPPHGITKKFDEMMCCAFTQTTVNFLKAMKPFNSDFNVIHYGHEDSEVDDYVDEHVTVVTNEDYEKAGYYNYDWQKEAYKFNYNDAAYMAFHTNALDAITQRLSRNDIVLTIGGFHFHLFRDLEPYRALLCDPSIGHRNAYADYRVYVSYPHMHAMYGYRHARMELYQNFHNNLKSQLDRYSGHSILDENKNIVDFNSVFNSIMSEFSVGLQYRSNQEAMDIPRFQDAVIPLPIDDSDFIYKPEESKEDFFLYLGRLNYSKGFEIAIEVAAEFDKVLVLAGQNNPEWAIGRKLPSHVKYLGGSVGLKERAELLSRAKIGFSPTLLIEPGPFVVGEYGFSGTPVISTDWGGHVDCVQPYINGFRCRGDFSQFCWAVDNIDLIKSRNCRSFAKSFWGLDVVGKMYDEYFKRIAYNANTGNKQVPVDSDRLPDSFWNRNKESSGLRHATLHTNYRSKKC